MSQEVGKEVTKALDQFPKTVEEVMAYMDGWKRRNSLATSAHDATQSVEQGSSPDQNQETSVHGKNMSVDHLKTQELQDSCMKKEQDLKEKDPKSYQTLKNIGARLKTNAVGAMMMIASAPKAAWKGLSKAAKGFVNMICRLVNRKRGKDNTKISWKQKALSRKNCRSQFLFSGRGRVG